MVARSLCLSLLATCLAAAPAQAIVGGDPVDPLGLPWYADVGSCGGTLVAPDRVLTAGHCVAGSTVADLGGVRVGGEQRMPVRVAMHPQWRAMNGDNHLEDVALVALDRRVEGVVPVTVGGTAGPTAVVVGRGRTVPPGTRDAEFQATGGGLRAATLRPITDAACARAYRTARGNGGERFHPAQMLCAEDVDGLAPLSSGCNGDSGGPLLSGPDTAPVLLGIVSWGGYRCGADRLPNVFADAARYRDFVADPAPVWAPETRTPAKVTGPRRVGGRLTCTVSGVTGAPARIAYAWQRAGGRRARVAARTRTYTVTRADAGHDLVCTAVLSNPGGFSSAPFDPALSRARIPRTS